MLICILKIYLLAYIKNNIFTSVKEEKELSHRQRQRARKRLLKKQNLNKKLNKLEKIKGKKVEDTLTEDVSFLLFVFFN